VGTVHNGDCTIQGRGGGAERASERGELRGEKRGEWRVRASPSDNNLACRLCVYTFLRHR
jgi:hypothetical protein